MRDQVSEIDQAGAQVERYRLAVPVALQEARIWVLWRFEAASEPGKKPLKVPYYTNGRRRSGPQGSREDLSHLATFEAALSAFTRGGSTGLGIAHVPGCGFVSLDFDDCIDSDGVTSDEVDEFVRRTGSYCEISPSGRGLRVVLRGTMASVKQITTHPKIEVFGESGFVTLTGNQYAGTDVLCELPHDCKAQLDAWLKGARRDERKRSDQLDLVNRADPIYQHLKGTNAVKREFPNGRVSIRCPFEGEHTGGSGASDTVYFLPHTNGYARGHFKCLHGHCAQRTDEDFLRALDVPQADVSALLLASHAAARTPEAASELSANFITDKNGNLIANELNALELLRGAPQFRHVYFDTFRESWRTVGEDGSECALTDDDGIRVLLWLQRNGLPRIKVGQARAALRALALSRQRDVLHEFLADLPAWDGEERIAKAFPAILGSPNDEYHQVAGSNFFKALAARAAVPGARLHQAYMFEGNQGIGKSTFLEVLGGGFYSEITASIGSDNFRRELRAPPHHEDRNHHEQREHR